jgi:TonB family protein
VEEVRKLGATEYTNHMILNTYQFGEKTGVLMKDLSSMNLQTDDEVFVIVEQMPEYEGGYDAMTAFLKSNIKYPEDARKENKSGTVYVQFVVDEAGRVIDPGVVKGVDRLLDAEAVRAISIMPPWKPGKQNGASVKTRMVMPVKFNADVNPEVLPISGDPYQMKVSITRKLKFGTDQTVVSGKIVNESGKGLQGINVLVVGTTIGTVTDADGNFTLTVKQSAGELDCSFIGYTTEKISF